jgi:hypothetical protein
LVAERRVPAIERRELRGWGGIAPSSASVQRIRDAATRRPRPLESLREDAVELADMPEAERPQKRPEPRRRRADWAPRASASVEN